MYNYWIMLKQFSTFTVTLTTTILETEYLKFDFEAWG